MKNLSKYGALMMLIFIVGSFETRCAWASGESPDNPIVLYAGGTTTISITSSGQEVWVRCEFAPSSSVSHLMFETVGDYDTYMYYYKNLSDASTDKYLISDDDSGENYNAKITYDIGYPSPYYVKLRMYSSSVTGSFSLRTEMFYQEPQQCSSAGPCMAEMIFNDHHDARKVLLLLRGMKELLARTAIGKDAITLYYDISRELELKLKRDAGFREQLYELSRELMPLIEEILRNREITKTLSANMLERMTQLKDLVINELSSQDAQRLESIFETLKSVQNMDTSITSLLFQMGYLLTPSSPVMVDKKLQHLATANEILVKFRQPLAKAPEIFSGKLSINLPSVSRILSDYSVEAIHPLFEDIQKDTSSIGLERIFKIQLGYPVDIESLTQSLSISPDIEYVEQNKIVYTQSNDVYFPLQYGLENPQYPEADTRATEAWETTIGSSAVLVAVVDTGIDYYHADLSNRVRVDLGYDYVNEDDDPLDDQGHGTHVAGIIGASYNNAFSIAGVAPQVSFVAFKVLSASGSGTYDDVAQGIVAAANAGAKVINLSLGGGSSSDVMEDALQYAYSQGCITIAAAGNDGTDELIYPAHSQYTIAIGATDNQNLRASFSNYGSGLSLMGPGVDIVSLFKDGVTCYASGTSMATPHVAGVTALMVSQCGSIGVETAKTHLFSTAFDLGTPNYDTEYGWGLVNAVGAVNSCPSSKSYLLWTK